MPNTSFPLGDLIGDFITPRDDLNHVLSIGYIKGEELKLYPNLVTLCLAEH